jgi:hypothetical protein
MLVDRLNSGLTVKRPETAAPPIRPAGESRPLTLVELLRTARELGETLTSMQPRPDFRATLYDDLVLSARRLSAQRALNGDLIPEEPLPASFFLSESREEGSSRRLVWGAVGVGLGSAVSVISVMAAYYWRRRHDRAA